MKLLHKEIVWNICRKITLPWHDTIHEICMKNTEGAIHCTVRSPLTIQHLGAWRQRAVICRSIIDILRGTLFMVTSFKFTTGLRVKALNTASEETPTRLPAWLSGDGGTIHTWPVSYSCTRCMRHTWMRHSDISWQQKKKRNFN